MVEFYYMSKNLEVSSLEDFFPTIKVHEMNLDLSMDDNHEAYLVRKMKKLLNSNKFEKKQANMLLHKKKKVRCFNYNEEGHIKKNCPKFKNKKKAKSRNLCSLSKEF